MKSLIGRKIEIRGARSFIPSHQHAKHSEKPHQCLFEEVKKAFGWKE